jgi:hypothetical protein
MWPFPGHYIVIAGYDEEGRIVKYVDPKSEYNNNIIREKPPADFIAENWFRYPSYLWWYPKARWGGRWPGIYRK